MTVTQIITLTNPAGTVTRTGTPTEVRIDGELQEPSVLECLFECDWSTYYNEADKDNPCQLNSYVVYTRQSTIIFRGYVIHRELIEAANGEQLIKVICGDRLSKLQSTAMSSGGEHIFTKSTPYDTITQIALKQGTAIGDVLYPFYPTPDTTGLGGAGVPWLPVASAWVNSTVLYVGMLMDYTYPVAAVFVGAGGIFYIDGNHASELTEDMLFHITEGDNEGDWTVVTAVYNAISGKTEITVASDETVSADTSGDVVIDSIMAAVAHNGMTPAGLIMIGTEWIQYDGYDLTDTTGRYLFKNTTRAALGTTAANHAVDAVIYQEISQKIHPAKPILVEACLTGTADWEPVPVGQYEVQVEEGRFDFTFDILAYIESGGSIAKYDKVRASYAVFDEDSASAVTLLDIINDGLTASVANGGPGLTAGQIDLGAGAADTTLANIRLTRVRVDEPENTLPFIHNLMDEIGLSRSSERDALVLWYDHENDKVICKLFTQGAVVDHVFQHPIVIDRGIDLEDCYSAVLITYRAGENMNLVNHSRMWHPDINDTIGSNAVAVEAILYTDGEVAMGNFGWDDTTVSNNIYTKRITDALLTTLWGLGCPDDPGDEADILYAWFNDAEDTFSIDSVKTVLDARLQSAPGNPFDFKLLGITDFTQGNPPTIGGDDPIAISGGLTQGFSPGSTEGYSRVTLEAKDIGLDLQAVLLRWDGPAAYNSEWRFFVRELEVKGYLKKTKLVQLTNNHKLGANYLYAPSSYNKLIDANQGQPRVKIIDIGPASDNIATSLGRLALLQALVLVQTRDFEIQAGQGQVIGTIPKLTQLVTVGDFTGTVVGVTYTSIGGEEILNLRVLNFDSGLI